MRVLPEIQHALTVGQPVVALESTVISHGLPWPHNLHIAQRMEAAIREHGAVPATIAFLQGELCIGLTGAEMQHLAQASGVWKVSRRDVAWVTARRLDGATTVAGTMLAAHRAGIRVFATGGIGGVHRSETPGALATDISADLPELARTPVLVVCAGAKAILDLPATLEWLETHGVPVIGLGTRELPAFFARSSGLPLDMWVDAPAEVAALARAHWETHGFTSGLLVTAPCPESAARPFKVMETAIQQALAEARAQKITGKAVTPFLLGRVSALTGGESQTANLALLENNARQAALIAAALTANH